MDRLARSLIDLQQIVDKILDKGARVHFVKEGSTCTAESSDSLSRLLLQMLGAFAEFERNLIRDRQAEGIRIAKVAGKYRSRARALTPSQVAEARAGSAEDQSGGPTSGNPVHPLSIARRRHRMKGPRR